MSNEPFQLKNEGVDYTIFSPKDHGFDFYSDILFTSQQLYKDNPQLVARFNRASLRGWEYAFAHIDEVGRDHIGAIQHPEPQSGSTAV